MKRRERKQITPDQERRRANRRQRIIRAAGRVLFLAILVAAAICALTIFFKVKTISVEGAMRYRTEEIAAMMGCPAATVRTRLRRAREKLKGLLEGDAYGESLWEADGTCPDAGGT